MGGSAGGNYYLDFRVMEMDGSEDRITGPGGPGEYSDAVLIIREWVRRGGSDEYSDVV
jgi:hypothetical protein